VKHLLEKELAKPSGLIDRTRPVQLIDVTPPQVSKTEKLTITYVVSDEIQDLRLAVNLQVLKSYQKIRVRMEIASTKLF
jgi:hypothetical protein